MILLCWAQSHGRSSFHRSVQGHAIGQQFTAWSLMMTATAVGLGAANNLNFSMAAVQEWYSKQQAHYLTAGVE